MKLDKKGKSAIIFVLVAVLILIAFSIVSSAHTNPQGKQTHPVGLETESCQDALAGAEEQLADRGKVNPRLLANIEDKCGVEECVEIERPFNINEGACARLSDITELNIPKCCTEETPGGISCGLDAEWVVGTPPEPLCFIPNS